MMEVMIVLGFHVAWHGPRLKGVVRGRPPQWFQNIPPAILLLRQSIQLFAEQ